MSPVTKRLISMRPGKRIEIGFQEGDIATERARMASRIRTAKLQTGYRYRCVTERGRLYVYCEEGT